MTPKHYDPPEKLIRFPPLGTWRKPDLSMGILPESRHREGAVRAHSDHRFNTVAIRPGAARAPRPVNVDRLQASGPLIGSAQWAHVLCNAIKVPMKVLGQLLFWHVRNCSDSISSSPRHPVSAFDQRGNGRASSLNFEKFAEVTTHERRLLCYERFTSCDACRKLSPPSHFSQGAWIVGAYPTHRRSRIEGAVLRKDDRRISGGSNERK